MRQSVRCMMCGESLLSDAASYTEHVKAKHSMGAGIVCRPEKTSSRTTAEIVAAVEAKLGPAIISVGTGHDEECRCDKCFNAKLDAIIMRQEIELQGVNNGPISIDAEN